MKVRILVSKKEGVLDPEAQAILNAAHSLQFTKVQEVRLAKSFELELDASTIDEAQAIADRLADQLLANVVIEKFETEVIE